MHRISGLSRADCLTPVETGAAVHSCMHSRMHSRMHSDLGEFADLQLS